LHIILFDRRIRKPDTLEGWSVLLATVADCHAACRIAARTEIAGTGFPDGGSSFAACYIALVAYYGKRPYSASTRAPGSQDGGHHLSMSPIHFAEHCVGRRSTEVSFDTRRVA